MENIQNKNEKKAEPKLLQSPVPQALKDQGVGNVAWKAAFGIIIIILAGSYFLTPTALPNLWDKIKNVTGAALSSEEKIGVTTDTASATNGEPFFLNITHKNKKVNAAGNYYLSYLCDNNVSLSLKNGESKEISCDQPFLLSTDTPGSFAIIPRTRKSDATTTIEISFVSNTISSTDSEISQIVTGKTTLSISNELIPNTPNVTKIISKNSLVSTATISARKAGAKTEKLYVIGTPTPSSAVSLNPTGNGNGDLVVKILKVGKIDISSNQFVETKILGGSDRTALVFEIGNKGTETIPSWTFSVKLPTNPPYTFQSERQQSLTPGDYVEYTIGFDGIAGEDNNIITVTADPAKTIKEISETNNTASVKIDGVNF